jgi:predicted ATP-dependent endonuclease of OLD family
MIAAQIEIKNFKSIGPEGIIIPLTPVTALVGQNSSGKSNVLLALDIFRNFKKAKISEDSFHNRDQSKPIEIGVTFTALTPDELRIFRRHLSHDNSLTILQSISSANVQPSTEMAEDEEGGTIAEKKTAKVAVSGIEWLDDAPTKVADIKTLWKQPALLVGDIDFKAWSGFSADTVPSKDDLKAKIEEFWNTHGSAIPSELKDTETMPLGWGNKLSGNLPSVIHIQAIKRFSEETKDSKSSPFGALLNWFVDSVTSDLRKEIQKKLDTVYDDVLASLPKELDAVTGTQLTRLELINLVLNKYIPTEFGSKLEVAYARPEVNQTIFGETGVHADDGFKSLIEHKGHGLQRSAILAVVRAYLELRTKLAASIPGLGRVIFAIEEPELFLHPTVKRTTYRLFRTLALNGDQVVYSTHDGAFLDVEHFHEIRVCRKKCSISPPQTYAEHLSEKRILGIWHALTGQKTIKIESIKAHLRNAYDPLCNEGFLAKKVLLVEGETETGALPIYLKAIGYDPDEDGCAIIASGSVELLDTFLVLFSELGIPVYVLWDGDHPGVQKLDQVVADKRDDVKNKSRRNANLMKMLGVSAEVAPDFSFPDHDVVTVRATILKETFEQTFHAALPNSEAVKGEATRLYGSSSKPMCARYYASEVIQSGEAKGDATLLVPKIVFELAKHLRALDTALHF